MRFVAFAIGVIAAFLLARAVPSPNVARSGAISTLTVRARPLGDGRVRFVLNAPLARSLPEPTTLTFRGTTIEYASTGKIVGKDGVELRLDGGHLSLELLARPTLIHYAFGHRTAFVPWLDDLAAMQEATAPIETETFMLDGMPNYPNGGQGPRCGPAFLRPRECREYGYPPRRWFIAIAPADDPRGGMIVGLAAIALCFALACRLVYRREIAQHGELVEEIVATDYRSTRVDRSRVATKDQRLRFGLRVALTAGAVAVSVSAVARYADGRSPIPMSWLVVLWAAAATLVACASLLSNAFRAIRPAAIVPALVGYFVLPEPWIALAAVPLALAGVVELFAGNAKVRRPNE